MPITETTREGGGDSVKTLIDSNDTSSPVVKAARSVLIAPGGSKCELALVWPAYLRAPTVVGCATSVCGLHKKRTVAAHHVRGVSDGCSLPSLEASGEVRV